MADEDSLDEVKSPIVMKVEEPAEDTNVNISRGSQSDNSNDVNSSNDVNTNNETESSGSQNVVKTSILAKPKFGASNLFTLRSSVLNNPKSGFSSSFSNKSILRPSQLGQTNNIVTNNTSASKPQLNLFQKVSSDESVEEETQCSDDKDENSKGTSNGNSKEFSSSIAPPKFVPLSGTSSSIPNTTSCNNFSAPTPSFVFGQNLHERVLADQENSEPHTNSTASASCSNGSSDTLFGSALKNETEKSNDLSNETKTLSEAAREYEESRAQKRKYEEVTVVTGEEDEQNIVQISCKLFAFDQVTRNWQERGRGNLRLNDIVSESSNDSIKSRLVIRAAGSLRVVLNTKIWAGMSVELASPKSIRLTAMDSSGIVKVFLVMANPKEIEKLYKCLKSRVDIEIARQSKQTKNESDAISIGPSPKKVAVDSSGDTPDTTNEKLKT